jgi:hypothetical protein
MWQIHIFSGNVKEVLRESSDLIALNFNEGTDHELCLHVRCLITNATSYNVLIGQHTLFPPSFTDALVSPKMGLGFQKCGSMGT